MIAALLLFLSLTVILLWLWRMRDHRADRAEANRLRARRVAQPATFSKAMVAGLPDPAQRYFLFTIQDGTPLHRVAEISMTGRFGMGTKAVPNYLPMRATQVLAAPEGFVWKMMAGAGVKRLSGSDSAKWTRFWLAGILPVARFGNTTDHALSSFGRYVTEAIFWTPAALLPGPGVSWEAVDATTARLTLVHNGLSQAVDVTVDTDGRPVKVVLARWSNANAASTFQFQPFGGYLSAFRAFDGFTLPTHVEGGNLIGTEEYFPFFIADVTDIRFR